MESKIFNYEEYDQIDEMLCNYYKVVFKKDFGCFKDGEQHYCISIDYKLGYIGLFDDTGELVKKVDIELALAG